MEEKLENCPCGSAKSFTECCEPVIKNNSAKTAEQLMRSRYSAYVTGAVDYILETTSEKNRDKMDRDAIKKWSEGSDWKGLEVVETEKGGVNDSTGKVEFIAHFREDGVLQKYHEIGTFTKEHDKWVYSDSEFPTPKQIVREAPKVGRNDPCPCGSGKKFKKCCANK